MMNHKLGEIELACKKEKKELCRQINKDLRKKPSTEHHRKKKNSLKEWELFKKKGKRNERGLVAGQRMLFVLVDLYFLF